MQGEPQWRLSSNPGVESRAGSPCQMPAWASIYSGQASELADDIQVFSSNLLVKLEAEMNYFSMYIFPSFLPCFFMLHKFLCKM